MTNSRRKGKNGELEFAAKLREYGHVARRGQQFKGGTDSPDVVVPTLPGVHFEVKRVEAGNLYDWMKQAQDDAGFEIPVVAHRKNGRDWVVIIKLDDFLTYFTGVQHGGQTDERGPDSGVSSIGGISEPDTSGISSGPLNESVSRQDGGGEGSWAERTQQSRERGRQAAPEGEDARSGTEGGEDAGVGRRRSPRKNIRNFRTFS